MEHIIDESSCKMRCCNKCDMYRKELQHYKDLEEKGLLVDLPCKVGDVVYIIGQCKDFPQQLDGSLYDSDGGPGDATGYYCPYEQNCPFDTDDCDKVKDKKAIFEDTVVHICIEEDCTWFVCENSNGWDNTCFGKTIFLTKSEAEQALKY